MFITHDGKIVEQRIEREMNFHLDGAEHVKIYG